MDINIKVKEHGKLSKSQNIALGYSDMGLILHNGHFLAPDFKFIDYFARKILVLGILHQIVKPY